MGGWGYRARSGIRGEREREMSGRRKVKNKKGKEKTGEREKGHVEGWEEMVHS